MEEQPRLQILKMIQDGKLSAEDGIRLLNAMAGNTPAGEAQSAPTRTPPPAPPLDTTPRPPASQSPPPDFRRWQNWWLIPLFIGGVIAAVSAVLMWWAWGVADNRLSVWLVLAACPFTFGVIVLVLAVLSRNAKWIHIRVNTGRDETPRRIALSFPVPFGPLGWLVNLIAQFNPELRERGVPEMIAALGQTTTRNNPLYVAVDEGESGERVQVYIG